MKYMLIILLAVFFTNDITRIAEINKRKKAAKEAYEAGNYQLAIEQYRFLIDSLEVNEEEVLLNLSNSYFNTSDSVSARKNYSMLTSSDNNEIRSRAYQQLGVMDFADQNLETALQNFKQSLKAEPSNEEARYNYELLKKILKEQEEQQQQQQDQEQEENQENQENQEQQQNEDQQQGEEEGEQQEQEQQEQEGDQENQEQQEQQQQEQEQEQEGEQQEEEEGEQKEDPMFDTEQLEELNISEEKARMILEAMKNNEIQYIQQNKRKATQPRKSGKPDW
jgi:hypothetical protein